MNWIEIYFIKINYLGIIKIAMQIIMISLALSSSCVHLAGENLPDNQIIKFHGNWVIYRYLYGRRMIIDRGIDKSGAYYFFEKNQLGYYHRKIIKNPKRWLGKRIIITESKIMFPDKLKIYDRYFDDRECDISNVRLNDGWFPVNSYETPRFDLDSDFKQSVEVPGRPKTEKNVINFPETEKYIYASVYLNCDETPFDHFFLMNEKDFVFNFAGVFFIAKRKE